MKMRQKQVAAALAAVDLYLREEAAALAAQAEMATERVAAADPGFWARAGHMEAMGVRRMMQMRAFARIQ